MTAASAPEAFPWTWAPRLSAIYDLKGDGRQKISAFWGRYFDPIRNDMSSEKPSSLRGGEPSSGTT